MSGGEEQIEREWSNKYITIQIPQSTPKIYKYVI